MIEATFRNGSLTAISVILGFSLSFLVRWSGLPGAWTRSDLWSVSLISSGILLQIAAVAAMLFTGSLRKRHYDRSVALFLLGLAIVVVGTGLAILGDSLDGGGRTLPRDSSRSGSDLGPEMAARGTIPTPPGPAPSGR